MSLHTNKNMREVFFDWDCTITRAHMYSMFASASGSSKSEMGRFLASVSPDTKQAKYRALTDVVARMAELYNSWGSPDDECLKVLEEYLDLGTPLLNPSEHDLLGSELCTFLFGNKERQDAITSMFADIQSQGKQVTILTKGLGACVLMAIKSFLPHWLGNLSPMDNKNDGSVQLTHCVKIVDYAGIQWHAGAITRSTAPLVPKLAQISVLLAQDCEDPRTEVQSALLVDDSAPHEIEGLEYEDVPNRTIKWKMHRVFYNPRQQRGHGLQVVRKSGVTLDCIAGGPKRNGVGLQAEDCPEIVRVAAT